MQINLLQKAYLLSREYALLKKDNPSSMLMLEAQKDLLNGFHKYNRICNPVIKRNLDGDFIMAYGTQQQKKHFTELALNTEFVIIDEFENKIKAECFNKKVTKKLRTDLALYGNNTIGTSFFWNWFVKKYGVPKIGERGFSAAPSAFCIYFIEDVIYGKN